MFTPEDRVRCARKAIVFQLMFLSLGKDVQHPILSRAQSHCSSTAHQTVCASAEAIVAPKSNHLTTGYSGQTPALFPGNTRRGGRVGLRRRIKAPISSGARVRIPSSSHLFDQKCTAFCTLVLFMSNLVAWIICGTRL
jgi:hypothetical protein